MAKQKPQSFREMYQVYLSDSAAKKLKLQPYQRLGIFFLIVVISGMVGWFYELVVALVETGEFYMQGGNLLPWINIYAIGAVLVIPLTCRVRKYPWAVFLIAAATTGAVELVGGWLVCTVGEGVRYWNYDHGVWLIGNINGFVCLASVVFFGLGSLVLMYLVFPYAIYLAKRLSKRAFLGITATLFTIIMLDEVANLTLKNIGAPNAVDFYESLGAKYQEF